MNRKRLSEIAFGLLGLGLFCLSVWVIGHELRQYKQQDILSSIEAISTPRLLGSIALTLLNYWLLTGYDLLALRYIRRSLPYRRIVLTTIISYAISNSVGFAVLTGGAIRYRLYSLWGMGAIDIARIVAFSNLGFWIGLFAVGGVVFWLEPIAIPDLLRLPFDTVQPISVLFLALVVGYLISSFVSQRSIKIGRWVVPHLPLNLSLLQILLTSLDWALAGGVLYVLLPSGSGISFPAFFGVYLLGQMAGLVSHVPGGLGVFETIVLLLLEPSISAVDLVGALLAYRGIFYFLPLAVALVLLGFYEVKQQVLRRPPSR
ncbi:MAG: UPF0104 family protein [Microcoleus sp. SIO2G3]|nr:UPF0104 family protein [Microcoleus sp. SIO2G3]